MVVVAAVYAEGDTGHLLLVLVVIGFVLAWFFLEHFRLHASPGWWQRSMFMEKFLNSVLMEGTKIAEQPIELRYIQFHTFPI